MSTDDKARKAAEYASAVVVKIGPSQFIPLVDGPIKDAVRRAFVAGYNWAMSGKGESIKAIYYDDVLPPEPEGDDK